MGVQAKAGGRTAFHHPRYLTMIMDMFSLGVGLYLAHATLQRLGGQVTVSSRDGGGTLTCLPCRCYRIVKKP